MRLLQGMNTANIEQHLKRVNVPKLNFWKFELLTSWVVIQRAIFLFLGTNHDFVGVFDHSLFLVLIPEKLQLNKDVSNNTVKFVRESS